MTRIYIIAALFFAVFCAPLIAGAAQGGGIEEGPGSRLSCARMSALLGGAHAPRNGEMRPVPSVSASYGTNKAQALDVYLPAKPAHAAPYPVILMIHGGAWCIGDKAAGGVKVNKINRWVEKGFIFVSANYRMLPDGANVAEQAADVTKALIYVQAHAADWQGDAGKIILMGHSAGAHLVSLIGADTATAAKLGAAPWLGTVSLDSAVVDVAGKMKLKHAAVYEEVFGKDPAFWTKVSPVEQLSEASLPWLGVCSSKRQDSCPAAHEYADKAKALGVRAEVVEEPLNHGAINKNLGEEGDYTAAVEKFMGSLDADVKKRLQP